MRKFIVAFAFCFFANYVLAQQETWDLTHLVEYAMQNNISVKQADVQARIAKLQVKQAMYNRIPSLNLDIGSGMQFGRSIDPTSNQFTTTQFFYNNFQLQGGASIFSFGRLKKTSEAASFSADAALVDVEKAANDVALNVAIYYLQVLSSNEQIEISKIQIAQTQQQYDVTRKQVEAGALPELNLAQLESQLATDSSNLVTAQFNYNQNLLNLKALMNLDAGMPFEVARPPVDLIPLEPFSELQPEMVYQLALNNQPLQKADALRVKAGRKAIDANKAALLPSLSGFYSFNSTFNNQALGVVGSTLYSTPIGKVNINGTDYDVFSPQPFTQPVFAKTRYGKQLSQNFSQAVGLNLSIPIFNNGIGRLNYHRSKLDLENLQLQTESDNQTLKSNIYSAYENAVASMQRYYLGEKTVAAAQKAYDFATKRYEVGLLSTLDLITTQNTLLTAKLQQLTSHYDYVFKMKVLEYYKGQGIKL